MEEEEETVFPYLGSCGWYRRWLSGEACQPQGHALTRLSLPGGQFLSVPVEGGYRRLRRTLTQQQLRALTLSDHADWPRTHLGAIRAAYGRAPYFAHYVPALERIYGAVRPGDSFSAFTCALHDVLLGHFDPAPFRRMKTEAPTLFAALKAERMPKAPDTASILHACMELGPETPFALI